MLSARPRVLWLGRPIKYASALFNEFQQAVEIVEKQETERAVFVAALRRGDYQVDAVYVMSQAQMIIALTYHFWLHWVSIKPMVS